MSNFKVRVMNPEDWALYKEVRLNSLKDSPDSFGLTYAREVETPDVEWQSRLDLGSRAKNALPLIAETDGKVVGLACWTARGAQGWDKAYDAAHGKGIEQFRMNQCYAIRK